MANISGSKYQEALYNTSVAFRDPALRGGGPALNTFGMPKPISGNFASVFTITGTDGRRWAVKCFTRQVDDQADRYQRISKTLETVGSSWKVVFEYLAEGVLVEGAWRPILKMEWVEAMGLLPFVEANLADQQALANLAGKFRELMRDLSCYGIAHGDLQHGNILVTPSGELKLIDYDGMFVPGSEALGASELGQENYQSPLRTTNTWGPDIDRFSSWVIYSSLSALALDPGLWGLLHAEGDEALLFHKDDFLDRGASRVRHALANSSMPGLQEIARDIDFLWAQDLRAIPPLDGDAVPMAAGPRVGAAPSHAGPRVTGADWLRQAGPPGGAAGLSSTVRQGGPIGAAAWLASHLPVSPFVEISRPPTIVRVVCAILLCFVVLFAVAAGFGTTLPAVGGLASLSVVTLLVAWIVSFVSYKVSPGRREMRRSRVTYRGRKFAATKANRVVAELENVMRKLDQEIGNSNSAAAKKADEARSDEQRELAAIDRRLGTEIGRLDRDISGLKAKQDSEARNSLRALQQEHVDSRMRMARVKMANIRGIGPALEANLAYNGITTAADFTGIRYTQNRYGTSGANLVLRSGRQVSPSGIGVKKAQSLEIWRRGIEMQARIDQPTTLSQVLLDAMSEKYSQRRQSLVDNQQAARVKADAQKRELRTKWAQSQAEIAKELSDATARLTQLRAEKEPMVVAARQDAGNANWQRDFAKRELDRYQRIRYRRYVRKLLTG
jgi:hypothetical protein